MYNSQTLTAPPIAEQPVKKYRNEFYAADYLGIAVATLRRHRLTPGRGPKFHKLGNSVRYTVEDLDRWARPSVAEVA